MKERMRTKWRNSSRKRILVKKKKCKRRWRKGEVSGGKRRQGEMKKENALIEIETEAKEEEEVKWTKEKRENGRRE